MARRWWVRGRALVRQQCDENRRGQAVLRVSFCLFVFLFNLFNADVVELGSSTGLEWQGRGRGMRMAATAAQE